MSTLRIPKHNVERYVRSLAAKNHVTDAVDKIDRMASVITSLSGDDVTLDNVERLLVSLKRKGVIQKSEMLLLQINYLEEKVGEKKDNSRAALL